MTVLAGALALSLLVACQNDPGTTSGSAGSTALTEEVETSSGIATSTEILVIDSTETAAAADGLLQTSTTTSPVSDTLAARSELQDSHSDEAWDSSTEIPIVLNGDSATVDGMGANAEGSIVTIDAAGTYNLQGTLNDGQIIIDTGDDELVRLILNGVDIRSSTSAPLYVADAAEVVVVLADGTQNTLTDGTTFVLPDPTSDEPNAALFSTADLTITGDGALTVHGNYNDGIASKDGLVIAGGTLTVDAVDDGIRGKDYVVVEDGNLTVEAQGDGLKSDNEEDAGLGYVAVEQGTITIDAGGDAVTAQSDVLIAGGNFVLTSGGGSGSSVGDTTSAKGIKGQASVTIDGGTFTLNAADDAIHSNGVIVVNDGTFSIATGDDGMHADTSLTIAGGDIEITESYEGLESAVIVIDAGDIDVVSSDDGLNVAGGNDGSGMGFGGRPGPGQDLFATSSDQYLNIHGGTIVIEAAGDGLDINGSVDMTGGVLIVNGPTEQMNGALDFDAGFTISGGTVIAAGSAGMAQVPGASSSQNSVLIYFSTTQPAGSLVHIQNGAGENVLTLAPGKAYQSLAFSSPALVQGETYTVYVGGSATGTVQDGVYTDGSYSGGTEYASFTVSSGVTQVGSGGGMRRMR
jgi:hypothetical protein